MAKNHNKTITELDIAKAVIAHEAVECFSGKEQEHSTQPKHLTSCTGGRFWGKPGEQWPVSADGEPLIPWLQVVCGEIKPSYGAFYNCKAACFYIRQDFTDYEASSTFDGSDFVVREYGPEDDLVPLVRPKSLTAHPFHHVIWEKLPDYPSLSKYSGLFDEAAYAALFEIKNFKYENRSGIKIGGWPTPVQRGQEYPGSSDLQIDMTKNFMYGDSGIGYLSRRGTVWSVMFECC